MFDGDERNWEREGPRRRRPLYTVRMVSRTRKGKRWQIDVLTGWVSNEPSNNGWWPLFSLYASRKADVYAVAEWVIGESHILD